jgi:Dynamin family
MPNAGPQVSNFAGDAIRRYDDLKLEVGAIAQTAMLQCAKAKDEESERAFQQLLARLAEDRFNLAVVGPFSRGKSSLMNAILGFEALPIGLLPHTSVITTVTYGPRERVLVRCEGWSLPQEIRLDQLEEYVTERGNPGNRRRVAVAQIQLPVEILRRGLHFIDTPGVGSAILANTDTTEKFLPEIDAAIFVSSFDSTVSKNDIEFLRRVRATVGVVFFVLNKLDLVSASEGEEVARFVTERFDRDPSIGRCALFSVSAKSGLEAKRAGDPAALVRSGLPELEAALANFLATDKTRQLAARVMDRLIACLERQRARAEFVLAANQSPQHQARALQDLDQRLAALKTRLGDDAARLGLHGSNALRALEPRIDTIFKSLRQNTLKKFVPDLLAGKTYSKPGTFDVFARDLSAFCRRVLTRELRLYEAALNEDWRRSAGPLLAQIHSLPDELLTGSTGDGKSGNESDQPLAENADADVLDLEIGGIAPIDWHPRRAWWFYLVPLRWFPMAVEERIAAALDRFLAEYREQVKATVGRAIRQYIDRIKREVEKTIDERAGRIRQSLLIAETAQGPENLDRLLQRARKLRRDFDDRKDRGTFTVENSSSENATGISSPAGMAGGVRACPVCRAIVGAVFENLSKLQYELSMETGAQQDHADTGGFCSTHTWIYSSLTSPVGISRAYPPLLDSRATKLDVAACSAGSLEALAREVRDLSPSRRSCGVCALAHRTARITIREVVKGLDANSQSAIPALCLPHVELALRCGADLERGRLLARACARALSRVADDMRRHGLKHDAIRRDLMTTDERDAAQIGLRKLVGEMLLVLPPREDDRL